MRSRPRSEIRPAVAVQVLFVLFGITIAAFFPFLALFLSARGLSAAQIGVVIAAMAVARIVANPVWGHVADTTLGRRTTLQIGALGAAGAAFALFMADGYLPIVLIGFVFAAFSTTAGPNIDAIALEHLGDERMGDYGRTRGWESLSYAVACLLIGFTLEKTDPTWTMPIYAVGMLGVAAWTITLGADRPAHRERHGRLGAVGAVFREAPAFWQFLLALLLVWTGFNAAWNFIALKIQQAGGGPLLVGIGTALGGLVEVPVMRLSSRFGHAWGLRRVFCLGCCIYALGFLLWGLIENPTIVSLLTVFEGMAFGLLFTTAVVVIGRMLPSSLYSTGQSMAVTAGFGIAPILGAGIGGVVFERFGVVTLYVGASCLALAGAAAAWIALSAPAMARPAPDVDPVL
jgi:MFS transporter, PPP family, 3-phenylpropionic acid transporter